MFKMRFVFDDREGTNTKHVNEALSAMKLSGLHMEDGDGYLAVRTTFDPGAQQPSETTYFYGFDQLELSCETEEGEDQFTWQVDTGALPKSQLSDTRFYHDMWCDKHPGRNMRWMAVYEYDDAYAFVVLHHEKV